MFFDAILTAAAALARYDYMLKTRHNSEILLAPLRSREAVISSRIEGTISTLDEILRYEVEAEQAQTALEVRQDTIKPYSINARSRPRSRLYSKGSRLAPP